jgi:hypothetical protein
MDGYILARIPWSEAQDIFSLPQVRHVAELADGNTFIAFDGELPYEGGTVFEIEQGAQDLFPFVPKIRSRITDASTEYLGLYTAAEFRQLLFPIWTTEDGTWAHQVAMVGCDLVLVLTLHPLPGDPVWQSKSERMLDKRLEFTTA